jgi:hypothetical protein
MYHGVIQGFVAVGKIRCCSVEPMNFSDGI